MPRGKRRPRTRHAIAVTAGKHSRRGQGLFCGGQPPFGWRVGPDGKHLEKNPAEQEVVQLINKLYRFSYLQREIADYLNERGYQTRGKKGKWHQTQVSTVLRNPARWFEK